MTVQHILGEILQEEESIVLAYLFGSAAADKLGPLSDIDIGILFHADTEDRLKYDIRLKLMAEIASGCHIDRIDIVDMEKSPVLLNFNIIKNGNILKSVDEVQRVHVETAIMSRYLDEKYYLQRHNRMVLKRISERGLA